MRSPDSSKLVNQNPARRPTKGSPKSTEEAHGQLPDDERLSTRADGGVSGGDVDLVDL
jgi:hypothetical protein